MRFMIQFNGEEWEVSSTEAPGEVLMTAEILDVEYVQFEGGKLFGSIAAAWGVTLVGEGISERLHLVRELGIARTFRPHVRLIPLLWDGVDFRDANTGHVVYDAGFAQLVRARMYYGNPRSSRQGVSQRRGV
jgi:hypothetical protein